uniref:Uncharacterized protein n=1 Tax=Picea glauca TaxID=3330 RepID=A0A101M287_PICGL|nr:hypothetical protein ABT39_MTgene2797 [Picea glauca]
MVSSRTAVLNLMLCHPFYVPTSLTLAECTTAENNTLMAVSQSIQRWKERRKVLPKVNKASALSSISLLFHPT